MMKSRYTVLSAMLLGLLAFSHCNKKEYTLESPPSKVEGLNGDWELYSVKQVDELSLAKEERDLSIYYLGNDSENVMSISFKSSDRTFEIELGDHGRNFLPSSGTWSFDNDNFPKYIYLEDDNGVVTTLKLGGPTRPQDQQLKIAFQRSCTVGGEVKEYVGYRYEFNRK